MMSLLLLAVCLPAHAEDSPAVGASAAAITPPVETALAAELARSMSGLRLPDAPAPFLVAYDVLDGRVVDAFAEQGALVSTGADPYRNLRVEVRVGDATFDSSNFRAFGEPDGVVQRRLPVEDAQVALRREIWLATDAAYKYAVEQYSRKQAARRDNPIPRPADWTASPPVVATLPAPAIPPTDRAAIEALVARLSAELATFGDVEISQAIARDWQGRRLVLTSEGTRLWTPTGYTIVRVEGTTRLPDGSTVMDSRSWLARSLADLPPEEELTADVRALGTWLTSLRTAPVEEDYLGPVLFEGPAAIELFSQLLAAEVVGTPPMEEDSSGMVDMGGAPSARIGRRLLPAGWSMVDDPTTDADVLGRYAYDQEGVAAHRVELVEDGVLRQLLMSRIPRKDLAGSTGHGRSLGAERRSAVPGVVTITPHRSVPDARMRRTGLRLAAQTGRDYLLVIRALTPPALVESLEVGIAGEGAMAGLTPPYEAYRLYGDGRTEPVRSVRFSGVDRRVLRDIALAGANTGPVDMLDGPPGPARYQIGPTGGLATTWDVPSVLITELEIAGSAGGEPRALPMPPREK
ncbi:MAG: metallopeptidase TldD-related protein [Pseudomonadota bacterium]|nr:metallopeptidase TldD-related protein [Pseudomonadota bacterium]